MGQANFSALYLPAQSGKTARMKERIDQTNKSVHIIISSNNKTLADQTSVRMGPGTLLWHSGKRKKNIYWEIMGGTSTVVCCANKTRFDAIGELLDQLESDERFLKKIYIWMDEGDDYIGLWKRRRNEWSKLESVVIISATQDACLKEFGEIRVLPYAKTFQESYQYSTHCNFIECDIQGNAVHYVKSVISSANLTPGMRLFIPGEKKRSTHYEICNLLLEKNVIVCLLNGENKCIYFPKSFRSEPIHLSGGEEMGKKIAFLYNTLGMYKYPFAITGHDCISRGVTFQTSEFFFTHAIIAQIHDNVKAYQMTSRMFGNILQYDRPRPIIVTTTKMIESVKQSESYAMTMAKEGKIVTDEMLGLKRNASVIMEETKLTVPISENVSGNLMSMLKNVNTELVTSILEYRLEQDGHQYDIDTFRCKQIVTPKRSCKFKSFDYAINNKKPMFSNFDKKDSISNVWQAFIDVKNSRIVFMIYLGNQKN